MKKKTAESFLCARLKNKSIDATDLRIQYQPTNIQLQLNWPKLQKMDENYEKKLNIYLLVSGWICAFQLLESCFIRYYLLAE